MMLGRHSVKTNKQGDMNSYLVVHGVVGKEARLGGYGKIEPI